MFTMHAAWVFPVAGPPIPGGCVTIDDGTIARVGPADAGVTVDLELGDAAIVPGFVNAHTHLELGPLPRDESAGPEDEIAWLGRVIRSRFDQSDDEVEALIRANLRSAIEAGTTAIGDISTGGRSWDAVAATPVWATVFAEVLGLSEARKWQTWSTALRWYATRMQAGPQEKTRPGLSPHAPYSTGPSLYQNAALTGLPLATHIGEMPAEREFLSASRSGPLREFVERLGAWDDGWMPIGRSPVDYVDSAPVLNRPDWVVAHGNILSPAEFGRLVPRTDGSAARRIAVAYCPRTHARFGHPPHPFRAMLDAGVVVCLGTDSLASSPSLSVLDEVHFLRRHYPHVPGATLLRMATLHGAWALRLDDRTGSLEPGKSADLAILGLEESESADPHDRWLDHDAPPRAVMFRGRFVAGPWG